MLEYIKIKVLKSFETWVDMYEQVQIAWVEYGRTKKEKILLVSLTAVAGVAALMAAGLMMFVIRRYYKRKDKLYDLTKDGDQEASRDYQVYPFTLK